jgi:hypothetical protein
MNSRKDFSNHIDHSLSLLESAKIELKSFDKQAFNVRQLIADAQEIYILFIEKTNPSQQELKTTIESMIEANKLLTGLLQLHAQSQLKEDDLIDFITAIGEHFDDIKKSFSPEEACDPEEEEEEQKQAASPEFMTLTNAATPASATRTSSSATSARENSSFTEFDILGLSLLHTANATINSSSSMGLQEEKYPDPTASLEWSAIIDSMTADIVITQKALLKSTLALKHENEEIKIDIRAFTIKKNALTIEEEAITKSTFKSKKHRAKYPELIKACEDSIRANQTTHYNNLQKIDAIELRTLALQAISDKLNALLASLLQFQNKSNNKFDHEECHADLLEIKDKTNTLLSEDTLHDDRTKAAKEIINLINTMLRVHAPTKDRKSALRNTPTLEQQQMAAQADQLGENDVQLLLDVVLRTQKKIQPTVDLFSDQAKDRGKYPLAAGRLADLEIIISNLNNIAFCLQAYPYDAFCDFASEEYPSFPQVFNSPNYLKNLRAWADKNNNRANEILSDELKAEIKEAVAPAQPSFLLKIWRNKFSILGITLGCLGGVALGIFTFGLGTSGLAAIVSYVAAVGSSGVGGACTNGIMGWLLDRWLEPTDEIQPLPPVRKAKDPENDFQSDNDDDDDIAPSPKHAIRNESPLPSRSKADAKLSNSRHSFQSHVRVRAEANDADELKEDNHIRRTLT